MSLEELDPAARKWLQDLQEDDVTEIREAFRLYRKVMIVLGFFKYLLYMAGASAAFGAMFGDNVIKLWSWLKGGSS